MCSKNMCAYIYVYIYNDIASSLVKKWRAIKEMARRYDAHA